MLASSYISEGQPTPLLLRHPGYHPRTYLFFARDGLFCYGLAHSVIFCPAYSHNGIGRYVLSTAQAGLKRTAFNFPERTLVRSGKCAVESNLWGLERRGRRTWWKRPSGGGVAKKRGKVYNNERTPGIRNNAENINSGPIIEEQQTNEIPLLWTFRKIKVGSTINDNDSCQQWAAKKIKDYKEIGHKQLYL